MDDIFALEGGNWVIIIAMFTASISLAGLTSKWVAARLPVIGKYSFFVYLSLTTGYFCGLAFIMDKLIG